ncbi:MAG: BNR repeat-containing protein, partial [Candidatus Hydrogenedentes bacterium]|nr:BNR repeat-containing protein [Candidatus Hydrogenedentota bacterium]
MPYLGLLLSIAFVVIPQTLEVVDVMPVWAGHPVGFYLLTHEDMQFIAFYDADRKMTVGKRSLNDTVWEFQRLPETLGWDSHNYITMAIDGKHQIHLSGNMHVKPLVYFRTTIALDITTFERAPMVGNRETRMTYPKFLRNKKNALLFSYRDGQSGNGEEIYNIYNVETQEWNRFLDQPLTSGEGKRNAYIYGPVKGPDNCFHICWVWRINSGCETNNNLSYAVSNDLIHWKTGTGVPVDLPMTLSTAEIIDPVPINGGILNGNTRLGFDSLKRPVVSYHKFDENGKTQIYNARLEYGAWKIYKTTEWDYRWEFSGGGTIISEIGISSISIADQGTLRQSYRHKNIGSGTWLLDEHNFSIIKMLQQPPSYPPELSKV